MNFKMHQPVPELPVTSIELSHNFYCNKLGFKIAWIDSTQTISGISQSEAVIFLRKHENVTPISLWIFADNVDETYKEFIQASISIHEPLETKPWGLRQFSIEDPDHNKLIFHE